MPAKKGEFPGLVPGLQPARRAEPDRGRKGVASSELRVVAFAYRALEA